jgi:hypothetical protein
MQGKKSIALIQRREDGIFEANFSTECNGKLSDFVYFGKKYH